MQLTRKPLPLTEQAKLRKLLDHEGFPALLAVLKSKAFEHEVEVANSALGSTEGYDAKAKSEAKKALGVHAAISLLTEMQGQPTDKPFSTMTATPSDKPKTRP